MFTKFQDFFPATKISKIKLQSLSSGPIGLGSIGSLETHQILNSGFRNPSILERMN